MNFICNSQNPEIIKKLINRKLVKQIMVYWFNRMLLSNEKETTSDTCNNMLESYKQILYRWSQKKERMHILWFSLYEVQKQANVW